MPSGRSTPLRWSSEPATSAFGDPDSKGNDVWAMVVLNNGVAKGIDTDFGDDLDYDFASCRAGKTVREHRHLITLVYSR